MPYSFPTDTPLPSEEEMAEVFRACQNLTLPIYAGLPLGHASLEFNPDDPHWEQVGLNHIANSFHFNLRSIVNRFSFVQMAFIFGREYQRLEEHTWFHVNGEFNSDLSIENLGTPETSEKDRRFREEFPRILSQWKNHDHPYGIYEFISGRSDEVAGMLSRCDGRHRAIVDDFFGDLLTQSWVAFETLASDLWETWLNLRPRLAVRALEAQSSEQTSGPSKQFLIDPGKLHSLNYNLTNHMGTLVKSKFKFVTLEGIKKAYKDVFKLEWEELKNIFDSQELKWLAAARNLRLHRAGVADSDFIRLTKDSHYAGIREGERPLLDCKFVISLMEHAAKSGVQVLDCARGWLEEHKN